MARKQKPVGEISKAAIRKRAQRSVSLRGEKCSKCGSTKCLQRHHHDYAKPTEVAILCSKCHRDMDHADGTLSERLPKAKCVICGSDFQPKRSRRSTICSSSACLAQLGKLSAEKRWKGETTDSGCAATESSPSKLQRHLSFLLDEPESFKDTTRQETEVNQMEEA